MALPQATRDIEGWIARYDSAIRVFLRRLTGCPHDADDIAQDTYLKIISKPPSAVISDPFAYLCKSARNSALDRAAKSARRRDLFQFDPANVQDTPSAPSSEQIIEAQIRAQHLLDVMATMPPRRREVFLMVRFQGISYAEISAKLVISRSAVEKHMIAALRDLRDARDRLDSLDETAASEGTPARDARQQKRARRS
ncbi:MAG: RNA polymerase sigma factor [Pseudomonadota bacterium]